MADSKLRLQIITALDSAGIKATKEQIGGLENQLKNLNSKGGASVDGLNRELTKMPGKFGKISEQLGGVAGKLGTVYAAWKSFEGGVKIGGKVFETFGDGAGYSLESIGNGFSSLWSKAKNFFQEMITGTNDLKAAAEANNIAMQNSATMVDKAKAGADKQIEALQAVREEHQKNIDKIKQETNTYVNQAQAVAGLKSAGTNAKVVLWESEKQSQMQKYTDAGQFEAAEQVGKAYDLMIAKEKQLGVAK